MTESEGKREGLNVDLVKQLILMHANPTNNHHHTAPQHPQSQPRITQEALEATTKLVKTFILEARRRASVEVRNLLRDIAFDNLT